MRTILAVLVFIASFLAGSLGLASLTQATEGVGLLATCACLLILVRIIQADIHASNSRESIETNLFELRKLNKQFEDFLKRFKVE